ncbi:hypothetical protein AC1031_017697 [Aphanomyces cochlioides]|nr:hypothetical protein AC1031_017697 [Aphanomyces cochlioides]
MSSETAPLNATREADHKTIDVKIDTEVTPSAKHELSRMFWLSLPVFMAYLLETLPGSISVGLVGHLQGNNTSMLVDAAYLSATATNVTALAIGFGLACAMDTLCSQAFGAGKLDKLGVYLQSGILVLGSSLIPIFFLLWNAESVMLAFGQDPEISLYAGRFSRVTMWGVPFLFIYELIKKLQQSQNIVLPMMYVAAIGIAVNLSTGYYFTYYTSWGYLGAALGGVCGNITLPVSITIYFYLNEATTKTWWFGFQWREAVAHSWLFLSLGVPSMMMIAMSWWAMCTLGFMAGMLPNSVAAVSVNAVFGQINTISYVIYLGISVSSNVLLGNALGANEPKRAELLSRLALYGGVGSAFVLGSILLIFRHFIAGLLVNDPVTIENASRSILALVIVSICDGMNGTCQGICKGMGRPAVAAGIMLSTYYFIGIPMAYVSGFKWDNGLPGIWYGFASGMVICLSIFIATISCTNWPYLAKLAQERVQK